MDQITQICKFFLLIIFLTSYSHSKAKDLNFSEYGNYLSWGFAKNSSDLTNLKKFFKNINLEKMEDFLLEEIFFESVILEEWEKANVISDILIKRDKTNFSANLFKFFNGILNSENVDNYLENVETKYFDINFLKAIYIWKNFNNKEIMSYRYEDCLPLICMHYAISKVLKGEKDIAQKYFENIEKSAFSSYRVKEILFYNSLSSNEEISQKYLKDLENNDLNINKYDKDFFKKNFHLLNPVLSQRDGMAEVLYNISSWFFSKDLYKYSAFFGKLSLKLRPDFNAMKLLLYAALEKIGYQFLGSQFVKDIDPENIYYYKFLKIKLSLFEDQNKNDEFLSSLEDFIKEHPERTEMKILFADKYRRLENYKKAVQLYSEIIENDAPKSKWNILYSRGISYERLNQWSKAERDLEEALSLQPEDAYILNYLAYSWLDRKKNIDKALRLLEKAVQIEPSDAYIIDSLGWAYYLNNQMKESVYFLEKAVSILPDDATLNDHLGDAYWKSNRKTEAISQWRRVLILDPNFKEKPLINKKIEKGL